jgi:hypothetical protein
MGMLCGTTNSVAVHVRVPGSRPASGSAPWSAVDTEDESGFHYSPNGGVCSSSDSLGNIVYAISLNCFPRRQKDFLLRFLDPNGAVMGTLRIVNPLSGPFPEWKPLPLPQTRTNGPVALTLSGFEQHVRGRWTNSLAKWRLDASDAAWAHAKARPATFLDASGNEGYKLSPRETAWKVRTLVYRERVQNFAADEMLVVSNVALPKAGNYTDVDKRAVCSGVTINILAMANGGRFGISNEVTRFMLPASQGTSGYSSSSDGRNQVETWGGSGPFLVVDTLDMQPGDELHIYAKDDQGREYNEQANNPQSGSGARKVFTPEFKLPPDAKSATIHVAVSRPLTFEFLVKPQDALSAGK